MENCPFDSREKEQYKKEVVKRWGNTEAYLEFEQKQESGGDFEKCAEQMMHLFSELGALRHLMPEDEDVQAKIAALQGFITDSYYTCTDEILLCLGQMYAGDRRFKHNIDAAGGEGTADFVKQAIEFYCTEK